MREERINIILALLEETQLNLNELGVLSNNFSKQYKQGFLNEQEYDIIKKELAKLHKRMNPNHTKFRKRSTLNKMNFN